MLTILVPTTKDRYDNFNQAIQKQLYDQYDSLPREDREKVEIVIYVDNRVVKIGEKRNLALGLSHGVYTAFVDSDDRLAPTYLKDLLYATKFGADVITFRSEVSLDGSEPKLCLFSNALDSDRDSEDCYYRLPNHLCAVKTYLAKEAGFPSNKQMGEDAEYSKRLKGLLRDEHHIGKVLYYYDYSTITTETQMNTKAPDLDVVILSDATRGEEFKTMTQTTIDTAIKGAKGHRLNFIVIETCPNTKYYDAQTITPIDAEFHYNKRMNFGASLGKSPRILFCNNDLEFTSNWLKPLLDANHSFVSPWEPDDIRQKGIKRNTVGTVTGRHMSGWCFMMTRELWRKIGGLDEDFSFWHADCSVIQQTLAEGVYPMIVKDSVVRHLGSQTFNTLDSDKKNDYTWAETYKFNKKYNQDKFKDNEWFQLWKSENNR